MAIGVMHVSKMIVVRREYRGQPLVVLVRNGRPWFDLKTSRPSASPLG